MLPTTIVRAGLTRRRRLPRKSATHVSVSIALRATATLATKVDGERLLSGQGEEVDVTQPSLSPVISDGLLGDHDVKSASAHQSAELGLQLVLTLGRPLQLDGGARLGPDVGVPVVAADLGCGPGGRPYSRMSQSRRSLVMWRSWLVPCEHTSATSVVRTATGVRVGSGTTA